jgi:hypothetical protein
MTDKESKFKIIFTAMDTTGSGQVQNKRKKHETDLIDAVNELRFLILSPVEERIPRSIAMP